MTVEVWPYVFNFFFNGKNLKKGKADGTYLRIASKEDRQFSVNIPGNSDAYGFLYAAARQGDRNQLRDYARIIFSVSMLLTTEQVFANDICKALLDWQERRMADGANQSQEITAEQERAAQTFMEDVAKFADAGSGSDRDKMRKEWKEEIKDILGHE